MQPEGCTFLIIITLKDLIVKIKIAAYNARAPYWPAFTINYLNYGCHPRHLGG